MEERYKTALEIILSLCINNRYPSKEDIQVICETTLKEKGAEDGKV
ncbi:MAG: hypothetical protein IJ300_12955 [Clostridia bacterium]|nr:hypothetical protein [Clostridia bacterium]